MIRHAGGGELTFNATSPHIARCQTVGLVRRKPLRPIAEPIRTLLVWPEIDRLLDGSDVRLGFPARLADRLIGVFIAGYYLTLSQNSAPDVDLEKLEDVDEVWALCFRQPKPGWRLIGRFVESTVFAGLKLYDRHELAYIPTYTEKANAVITEWNAMLGIPPFRAQTLGEYVGGIFSDVDQPEQ